MPFQVALRPRASISATGTELYDVQVMVRLPLTLEPKGDAVHLSHARGYLYLTTPTGVAVFNTTGFGLRRPPKMVSAHSLGDIALACTADESLVSQSLVHP